MAYTVTTPWLLRLFYPSLIWSVESSAEPTVYITFDDGPHPTITPFVLQQLESHNAKGTFFCIGKNVVENPDVYKSILAAGHAVGNHTHNHLNGWKTDTEAYISNIAQAETHIRSRLFRPPYGRIKRSQIKKLTKAPTPWKICMWNVLSADFDTNITPEKCLDNVLKHIQPGSIIIFHDSEKAWPRMSLALPAVLGYCNSRNWQLKALPQ